MNTPQSLKFTVLSTKTVFIKLIGFTKVKNTSDYNAANTPENKKTS